MIHSLKGARRQFLVSASARVHTFQRKFGQRFPCPNEDGERNDTSEPRDEEKRKPESIRTTGFQCFLAKISHKTLALRDVQRDDELMQRLGAARQTVEEVLERCVRGYNPVVVRARAGHGPPKGQVSQRLVKVHTRQERWKTHLAKHGQDSRRPPTGPLEWRSALCV